jgi:glutathione synthase/RimK-type ligase-like ATP-grasp enzyme
MMRLLRALGSLGQSGRTLAYRIDLGRSLGPGEALRRLREDRLDGAAPEESGYAGIWGEAAEALGAHFRERGFGFYEFRKDGRKTRAWRYSTPLDDPVTLRLALDKTLTHDLIAEAGMPTPENLAFDAADPRPAVAFLRRIGGPCVVKPATSSFGSGVTGAVETPSQVERACWRASRLSARLLIEQQAIGDVYRLLFLDGELIDIIRRHPPAVTGDGTSSIGQLVVAENRRRIASYSDRAPGLLRLDLDALFALEHAGLRPRSTPAAGVQVRVKTVVSQNSARENETVRTDVTELAADVRLAVTRIGLRLAGVDVVTTDPSRSLGRTGGVILEVNGAPGLHYHYEVADPANATRVAIPVLEAMLS